jgi:hypothetical protein
MQHIIRHHTIAEIERLISLSGLPAGVGERVRGLVLPSMRMRATPAPGDDLPLGASKVGGMPDLPFGVGWPVLITGQPLDFLCQVNLADLPDQRAETWLPRQGLLSFFYIDFGSPDYRTYAYPHHRAMWRVLFYTGDFSQLHRASLPEQRRHRPLAPCVLDFALEWSLPVERNPWFSLLGFPIDRRLSTEEIGRYFDLLDRIAALYGSEEEPAHRLFGYAGPLPCSAGEEEALQIQCCRTYPPYSRVLDWRLLLQLDEDQCFGSSAVGMGRLFFMLLQDDLLARRFDRVLLVRQIE